MDKAQRKVHSRALAAVEAELEAALAILFDRRCRPDQACVHVLRGWQGLARLQSSGAPDETVVSRWIAQIDARDIAFLSPNERSDWERTLLEIAAFSALDPVETSFTRKLSRRDLWNQCSRLQRALRACAARLKVSTPLVRRRRIAIAVALAVVGAAIAWYGMIGVVPGGPWLARYYPSVVTGDPWLGRYYPNVELTGDATVRQDRDLFFDWGAGAPLPQLPRDDFSAAWDTCLRTTTPERVRFVLGSDDGSRLSIDGTQIIDNWGPHDFRTVGSEIDVAPGVHLLHVEFFDNAGAARIVLRVARGGGGLAPLSPQDLFAPRSGPAGSPVCEGTG